jgi:excisionase family DNA binding protein
MSAERMLYKPAEAADAIGVSRARAYELIAAGTIPSIRIGGSIRVPVDALREWINQQLAGQEVVEAATARRGTRRVDPAVA